MSHAEPGPRMRLHDAIQASNDVEDEVQGAALVGWVLVAEWMDGDGRMWLSKLSGKAGGTDSPVSWVERGYLHEALYNWSDEADPPEENP